MRLFSYCYKMYGYHERELSLSARDNSEQAITNLHSVQYLTSLPNVNSLEEALLAGLSSAKSGIIMPRKVEVGLKYIRSSAINNISPIHLMDFLFFF